MINQKGGVGKTTTVVSLAHGLALQGRRVLVVDLDAQGNASLSLGAEPDSASSAALLEPEAAPPPPSPSAVEAVSLYGGGGDLVAADFRLVLLPEGRHQVLKRALDAVEGAFDNIIIDAPPSLGMTTLNILHAADNIVIPVQAEYLALEGVINMQRTLEALRAHGDAPLNILGYLVTMVDSRTNISNSVVDGLREALGDQVFNATIPRTVRLSECPGVRRTIFDYDRWGSGARAYEAFTYEYLGRLHGRRKKG
ncbi:MAG: ParA family protein [Candidatus Sumerlaeia bacterium]|nr:ParA family protein [Candidatus Sumerlaeia bacterium]